MESLLHLGNVRLQAHCRLYFLHNVLHQVNFFQESLHSGGDVGLQKRLDKVDYRTVEPECLETCQLLGLGTTSLNLSKLSFVENMQGESTKLIGVYSGWVVGAACFRLDGFGPGETCKHRAGSCIFVEDLTISKVDYENFELFTVFVLLVHQDVV